MMLLGASAVITLTKTARKNEKPNDKILRLIYLATNTATKKYKKIKSINTFRVGSEHYGSY